MERLAEREAIAVPTAVIVLASGAAVALCLATRIGANDLLFSLLWLSGWTLVVWAALLGGGYAVFLVVRACSRQPVLLSELALTAAALLLVGAVVAVNPPFGAGAA